MSRAKTTSYTLLEKALLVAASVRIGTRRQIDPAPERPSRSATQYALRSIHLA